MCGNHRTSLIRCPGKPTVSKSKRASVYGSDRFVGCSCYHLSTTGAGGGKRHFVRNLTDLTEEGISYLERLLSGEASPKAAREGCRFILEKRKRSGLCALHISDLIHLRFRPEMTIIEPVLEEWQGTEAMKEENWCESGQGPRWTMEATHFALIFSKSISIPSTASCSNGLENATVRGRAPDGPRCQATYFSKKVEL